MHKYFLILSIFFLSCKDREYSEPHILIETGYGDIEIKLFPKRAPKTVEAFLTNIEAGAYRNATFYRVLKADEMPTDYNSGLIQGGIYYARTVSKNNIPHESTAKTGLSHSDGTISMARTKPGSASTEFFICIGDQTSLDSGRRGTQDSLGMAAFGKVVKGMKIVRKIQNQKSNGDKFDQQITITRIRRL